MTPLIDVTFLLLTYFMLASHYASAEKPDIHLPQPNQSQAVDRLFEDKLYLNLLYVGDANKPRIMYGPLPMPSVEELSDRLTQLGQNAPQTQVILRADRRVNYGRVREVMEQVAGAGLQHLQVVAELEVRP